MSMVYVSLLVVFAVLLFRSRKYARDTRIIGLDKEHPLRQLYPLCVLLFDAIPKRTDMVTQRTKEALNTLNLGREKERIHLLHWCKKTSMAVIVVMLVTLFSLFYEISNQNQRELLDGYRIQRPQIGETQKKVELRVGVEGKSQVFEEELELAVEEQRENDKVILKKLQKAKKELAIQVLGNNSSAEEISENVVLSDSISDTGIKVSWDLSAQSLINTDGTLENEELPPEGGVALLYATLSYYDHEIKTPIYLHVQPKKYTVREKLFQKLKETIGRQDSTSKEMGFLELPTQIEGKRVFYQEKQEKTSVMFFVFSIMAAVLLYFLSDEEISKQVKKRETEVLIDYPEIVNKLVLLLGAGATMKHAWETIVNEYLEKRRMGGRMRYAYEEMYLTMNEISNSAVETKAYEDFGKRMKVLVYLRFATLISQNLKKGSKGLLDLLECEAVEAFDERKQLARQQGEEASTKLLLPMGLMLLVVLVIIMVPAFLGL